MEEEFVVERTLHHEEAEDGACPSFIAAMDVVGRRWSGLIIEAIGRGNSGFADIGRFVAHIGDTMLAKRLRELETDGLIEREVVDGRPIRVRYSLTPAGRALQVILQDLTAWGHAYALIENAPPASPQDVSPQHTEQTRN
ncbi:transcriptional regulator, HxlR family [Rathayibacter oskolensis]|uniref:Transcriptional regulator, HxlR family n=1 Tax=Rathayibacter oskolensis TaxID=1891671 RepID=A0A1X7PHW2_9MICO|nr:helix-turn-helix domain-containing protein [Rathayibacter oskolensis]SMH51058.1 transcriptional regulator, HxlR family [Rathayibacter oskolensis]